MRWEVASPLRNAGDGWGLSPFHNAGDCPQYSDRLDELSSCVRNHAAVCLVDRSARLNWSSRSIPAIRSVRNAMTTTTAASSIRFLLTSR